VANAKATASALSGRPEIALTEGTPATYKDPALTRWLSGTVSRAFGAENVREAQPMKWGEDFSEYGFAGVPAVILWGFRRAEATRAGPGGRRCTPPSSHRSGKRTLRTGVATLTTSALELLGTSYGLSPR
jgi:hippurate hydrolase